MNRIKSLLLPIVLSVFLFPLMPIHAQYDLEEVDEIEQEESYPINEEDTEWDLDWREDANDLLRDYEVGGDFDLEKIDIDDAYMEKLTPLAKGLAVLGVGIWLFIIGLAIAVYIFSALALSKIGKEMSYSNPWFAWLPILSTIMLFQLGEQNPLLILLTLIPAIGPFLVGVFSIISFMKITEKRGYDKLLALIVLTGIGTYILLYLLAWKPKNTSSQPEVIKPAIEG
ncbi:hypothetical protein GX888_02970 [Candidatus Dojkabacteria bacterium]|uniref:Uncharacterized protein n=1 Tax=Candidatus Dojkabacteria bacterium TaxID=2099670 RepID=A0A847VDQ8_9BACT|nr:hypothetical protein [Candidatus Dojkabacteria bacterium]